MNVKYWTNFYKKKNSTRQPLSGTTATVTLKEPTSFHDPVILATGIPKDANYFSIGSGVWITSYDAYYFVTDVIAVSKDLTEFHLKLDPMATFKSLIGTTYAYVVRQSDPTKFNPQLTDPLNPPAVSVTVAKATTSIKYGNNISVFDLSTYRYLLSAVGAVATIDYALNNGFAKTYIMSGGQMALLASKLCTQAFLENLVNEFTNPMESITRCIGIPVDLSGMTIHSNEPIFLGSHSTTVIANVLVGRVLTTETALALPTAMTGSQTYLNRSPYCTATIYLPFVGVCPLDVDVVTGRGLNLKTVIDCYTGDITYAIKDSSSGSIFATYSGNCATEIPVSSMQYSAAGIAGGVMATIGGVASQNPIMAASGIMAAVSSLESHSQTNGSYSSMIGGWQGTDAIVTLYKRDAAHSIAANAAEEGLPYEDRAILNSLPGYLLCRNASVDIPGCDQDKEAINQYLNSGFYYE